MAKELLYAVVEIAGCTFSGLHVHGLIILSSCLLLIFACICDIIRERHIMCSAQPSPLKHISACVFPQLPSLPSRASFWHSWPVIASIELDDHEDQTL